MDLRTVLVVASLSDLAKPKVYVRENGEVEDLIYLEVSPCISVRNKPTIA